MNINPNHIKVNKEEEERLYRIMKELELEGESLIHDARGIEWQSTMRKFGIRAKPLVDKNLIEPIWTPFKSDRTLRKERLIRTKRNVQVKEVDNGKNSFFVFEIKELKELHKKRRILI